MRKIISEPYRLFFPVGWLLGLWGVVTWLLFARSLIPYPGVVHSYIMIGGFLSAFTAGFIMTALPRFTGTFHAEKSELSLVLLGLILLPLLSWRSLSWASACVLLIHGTLILFFLRRFWSKQGPLPVAFLFLPMSLGVSVLGHTLILLSHSGILNPSLYLFGRLLAFNAFMLGVVLGVGSKIIPMFLGGFPGFAQHRGLLFLNIVFFFSSYFVQHFYSLQIGLGIRFLVLLSLGVNLWTIQRRPLNPSKISYGLWLSCWGLILGTLGGSLFPSQLIHWSHVLYISGFGLMTLMIGSRVVLAHGGFDLSIYGEGQGMVVIMAFLLLSALLRLLVGLYSAASLGLITISSILWISALALWWFLVGRRTFASPAKKQGAHC